jgi:hypothetical protein
MWDVFLTLILAALALTFPRAPGLPIDTRKWLGRLLLFNGVCLIGSLLDTKHVYPLAALSQLIMWNEPILLFLAVIQLPFSFRDIDKFRKLLLFLIGLEIAIGLFQVPIFFKTGSSEDIIGTFQGNAEQYQLFVLIGLFYLLAQLELGYGKKGMRMFAILLILILVVLIDNKASWVALAVTLVILLPKLPDLRGRVSGKMRTYGLLATILLCGYQTVKFTSATYSAKFSGLAEAIRSGNLMNLGKVKALRDVVRAYRSYPQMALVGSGLGTFYSRAAFQFFPFTIGDIYRLTAAAPVEGEFAAQSASMAGIIKPVVGKEAFYRQFYNYEKIYPVGSGTADFPTSSYISLLGETGILGTILYLGFYLLVFRALRNSLQILSDDPHFFPFAAAAFGVFIYLTLMGSYNFWLDCGRVNTIVWSIAALSLRYVTLKQATESCEAEAEIMDPEGSATPEFSPGPSTLDA